MKTLNFMLLIFCLVFGVFAQENDSLQYIRSNYFAGQRTFPFDSIPSDAYNRAIIEKNNLRLQLGIYAPINYWQPLGPTPANMPGFANNGSVSGRTKMVLLNQQNANIAYIAAAGGGLWKTSNVWDSRTNVNWTHLSWNSSVIDVLASGAFCIDPYDPTGNTIYYGTGEATDFWSLCYMGDGIYKSTDGGISWVKGQGLPSQTKVFRICVRGSAHRNIIYAALGTTYWNNPYIASRNCGLYISTDGGLNWAVVPWSQNLHCTDIAFNPQNDLIGYCMGPQNGGPQTYLPGTDYRTTTDGGNTWNFIGENAFDHTGYHDNTFLSISPTNPNIIYVLTCESGTIAYRSTNGGASFNWLGNYHFDAMWDYNMFIRVSPWDPNIVFVGAKYLMITNNGLATDPTQVSWNEIAGYSNIHDDIHYMDIDQSGPPPDGLSNYRFLVTCDGGVYRTTNGGSSFESLNDASNIDYSLNTVLFYAVANNPFDKDKILGSAQDNAIQFRNQGTNSWTYSSYTWGDGMGVCMSQVKKDNAVYFNIPGYDVGYSIDGGNSFTNTFNTISQQYYCPLASHPTIAGTFYLAQTDLVKSTDNGASWNHTNIPIDHDQQLGNLSANVLEVCNSDLIYAATYHWDDWDYTKNKQHLWVTTDGGLSWTSLFIENKVINRFITSVKVNKSNFNEILITLSGFSSNQNDGHHIYRSLDAGNTFQDITGNLVSMDIPVNDLIIYDQDCNTEKYIIATDIGIFISDASDQSNTWQELGVSLPTTACLKLDYYRPSKKLRVANFGIGAWELDLNNSTTGNDIYVKDHYFLDSYPSGLNIDCNIIVCNGGILDIPNSCTLKFATGKGITIENGGQIAAGANASQNNMINLTSQSGIWNGITFQYSGYGTLDYCNFQNTSTAVLVDYSTGTGIPPSQIIDINSCTFNGCAVEVNDNSVMNTYIEKNSFTGGGIAVNYSNAVQILNNTITGGTNGSGIYASSSDILISNNNISNCGNAVYLDNSVCNLNSNTMTGQYTVLGLSEASPILYSNNISTTNTMAVYDDYYSYPRMRPSSPGDGTLTWDAGINHITVSGSPSTDIEYMESSVDLAGGINFMNGASSYLDGYIYPSPYPHSYDATGNCWDGGVCDPNRFSLYADGNYINVSLDPCNCTPPYSYLQKEDDLNKNNLLYYMAGGENNLIDDPMLDPIQPIIINRGNGHYDTIKVTQGNINLSQNETVLSQAAKQELLGNYPNALNIYESVVQNYHDSTSAIKAVIKMLPCTDRITNDTGKYTSLWNFYQNVLQSYPQDTALSRITKELTHKVLVRKSQYPPAITAYEYDIDHTLDTLQILNSQLNIVEIYMLFPPQHGNSFSFTGKYKELKPATKQDGFRMIAELLHHKKLQNKVNPIPKEFKLSQNYPNPFNPTTRIDYQLPSPSKVTIKVYDILGRLVKTLVNNEQKEAGYYSVTFDGTPFASGVYFYRIEAGKFINVKKMVILK